MPVAFYRVEKEEDLYYLGLSLMNATSLPIDLSKQFEQKRNGHSALPGPTVHSESVFLRGLRLACNSLLISFHFDLQVSLIFFEMIKICQG